MARNEDITLTAEQARTVAKWEGLLTGHEGETVKVDFIKRDGTPRTLVGVFTELYGARSDHRVIKVDTAEGPRSANLYAVQGVDYA
jgi:hypothetical protein